MAQNHLKKVALLASPWPIFNRPSIQLGTLKAYLQQALPDLAVDTFHLYLPLAARIGYPRYAAIAERTWLAEPVFAALLFPEKAASARALFEREAGRHADAGQIDFRQLVQTVGAETDRLIAGIDWESYLLAGVTISLCQLTAALYVTREIKRRCPGLSIVAGGASVAGESGRALVQTIDWIDVVVNGEGEKPLLELIQSLRAGRDPGAAASTAVVTADGTETGVSGRFDQFESLANLPRPDYDDYFSQLRQLPPAKRFFPVLPVEMSRGCWWQKKLQRGGRGCAFCNLNTQWHGHRTKRADQVVAELERLKARYQLVNFAFMDNALPVKIAPAVCSALAATGCDFALFGEIRATTDYGALAAMRQAGLEKVQIGIEALSSRLLNMLNKGTTTIANLEVMRNCEELGIENRSNLIVYFPGSDEDAVAETLQAIEFAGSYRPLKPVPFWLGLGSPVCGDFKAFGLQTHFNHPHYKALLPQSVRRKVPLVIQAYRGDRGKQKTLWAPVLKRIRQWEKDYTILRHQDPVTPVLGYRDGGDFIILRQRYADGPPSTHRLTGSSREIYLFCRHRRDFAAIVRRHPAFSSEQIKGFLDDMVGKRLMFTESGQYLSLAVRTTAQREHYPRSAAP
jgi:ribosomal peptide maturation radical SAM protein 1